MAQSRGRATTRSDDPGFTELLIVIALVAITAIGVVSLFGEQIEELFSGKAPEASAATRSGQVAAPAAGNAAPSAATSRP